MSCSPRLSATRMAWGFCTFSSVTSTTCVTLARSVEESARLGQIARADLDVVAPLGQVDADGFHGGGLQLLNKEGMVGIAGSITIFALADSQRVSSLAMTVQQQTKNNVTNLRQGQSTS